MAFDKIEQNEVVSSWKDALTSNILNNGIARHIEVPVNGCLKDISKIKINNSEKVLNKIWSIGGTTGYRLVDFNYRTFVSIFINIFSIGLALSAGR